jgi:GTP-sensing pleiotropic transcriptional regulator CodY
VKLQGKDAKIIAGKYAGLVGNVEEVKANGMAHVHIAGVIDNQPIDKRVWLKVSQLEGGNHG